MPTINDEYQRALKNLEALTEQERQLERYKEHLRAETKTTDHLLYGIKNERLALAERLRTMRMNMKINKKSLEEWMKKNPGAAINATMLSPQQGLS